MSAAQQLREYLAESLDISDLVGADLYVCEDFAAQDAGQNAIVVVGTGNPMRLYFRMDTNIRLRLLSGAIKNRIGELPLGEVVDAVQYSAPPHSGRIIVTADWESD